MELGTQVLDLAFLGMELGMLVIEFGMQMLVRELAKQGIDLEPLDMVLGMQVMVFALHDTVRVMQARELATHQEAREGLGFQPCHEPNGPSAAGCPAAPPPPAATGAATGAQRSEVAVAATGAKKLAAG